MKPPPSVLVEVKHGATHQTMLRFTDSFVIGRDKGCGLQIMDPRVSDRHVKIEYDGDLWRIRDLSSADGTYMNAARIEDVVLTGEAEIELGRGGPVLWLAVEGALPPLAEAEMPPSRTKEFSSETQIIRHYFERTTADKVGEQTMMFRRAFERVHKKKSRKYYVVIGAALFLLLASGGVILYQKSKIAKLRQTAESIFYAMKSLELQIAQLEDVVMQKADARQVENLQAKRSQLKEMEKSYDKFVTELGIYNKLPAESQIIFKYARFFGECDVNIPRGFVKEVSNYIEKWKTTDRLKESLRRANSEGYTPMIVRTMTEHNLPPHFFFLALQESGFQSRIVGPKTRFGYAKGIWQFIPMTANQYGLRIGPRAKEAVYDPHDERYDVAKATEAAARYLRDINNTEAQASGLLVMASYNWGENKTRKLIQKMPGNPRERNFWRLLSTASIPRETYDYVFYIFSAAVICENPRLFGFDFDPPDLSGKG
jgi:peptidoglycan lytic transglycosylase D